MTAPETEHYGMSTTWKSLAVGFGFGVMSTGLYAIGAEAVGVVLWVASLLYIAYTYARARALL